MMADLFSSVGTPDWKHVTRVHPELGHPEEFRVRELQHPTRHLEVQRCIQGHWHLVRHYVCVREIAELAGLQP